MQYTTKNYVLIFIDVIIPLSTNYLLKINRHYRFFVPFLQNTPYY